MHSPRRCGGSCAVGTHCQIRALESGGKVASQRLGIILRRAARHWVHVAWHDVGRQLLAVQRQQGEIDLHGERQHWGAVRPGRGAKAESLWWNIRNLLKLIKQPVDEKKESKGPVPTKKPRDLFLLDLGTPVPGEKPTLEIKRDNKTIVDSTPRWKRRSAQLRGHKTSCEKGGVEECAYGSEPPIGSSTPFVNTTKKLTCEQEKSRGCVQKNGWTPPASRGKSLPVSVGFGMEALTTAGVGQKVWPCTRE